MHSLTPRRARRARLARLTDRTHRSRLALLARRSNSSWVSLLARCATLSSHPLYTLVARVAFYPRGPLGSSLPLWTDLSLGRVCHGVYASILRHVYASPSLYRDLCARARQRGHVDEAW